ncbi:MAG: hypothetical protein QNJ67_22155 [Kiloniellales bacterium]|nr:hypothetical protein [Kiloniellales bacterium]
MTDDMQAPPAPARAAKDSTAWTGLGEPDDVTEHERSATLVYRITAEGAHRAARRVNFLWIGFLALAGITVGMAFLFPGLPESSKAVKVELVFTGIVMPPVLAFLGYVLWKWTVRQKQFKVGAPILQIDDHGFSDSRQHRGRIPWYAVESIVADSLENELSNQGTHVFVRLKSPTEDAVLDAKGKPLEQVTIWTTPLGLEGRHLARVMRARWEATSAQDGSG